MDRRTALSAIALPLLAGVSGCTNGAFPIVDAGSTPREEAVRYETRYWKDPNDVPVIEGGLSAETPDERRYATLVTTPAEVSRFHLDYVERVAGADVAAYVRETDFEGAFLLVLQVVLPSGSMDYEVERIDRKSEGRMDVATITPPIAGGTGEVLRATVVVRVTLADAAVPKRITITYANDPYHGGETTFVADGRSDDAEG